MSTTLSWAQPGHPDAAEGGDIPVTAHPEQATVVLDLRATALLRCGDGQLTLTVGAVESLVESMTQALEELDICREHDGITHPTSVPCGEALAELAAETWGDAA